MLKIIRVTEEWQRAGVHYVRCEGMLKEFGVTLEGEFAEDSPSDIYILAIDDNIPVSACRIRRLNDLTGKIERVCTIASYRNQGIGAKVIKAAEEWLKESGAQKIYICSREQALPFYERLGYKPDYEKVSGEGLFRCIMTEKEI